MPSHGVARNRTLSHVVARCRTESHAVASFGGYCEDSGGFCQNRASGGPLDKQVYSLDFLNGSREPCGAKQAPRGGRVGPPAVEMWRSLRDRPALRGPWTGAGTPRGQPGGCPPAAPTPAHRLPGLPHISTAGGLAAAIGATTLIFFQPLSGAAAPARFACPPLSIAEQGQEGEPAKPGEPRRGAPGGRRGARRADRGAARPRPLGDRLTPLWGAFGGGGGAARRVGEPPPGVPREASSIERKTLH